MKFRAFSRLDATPVWSNRGERIFHRPLAYRPYNTKRRKHGKESAWSYVGRCIRQILVF